MCATRHGIQCSPLTGRAISSSAHSPAALDRAAIFSLDPNAPPPYLPTTEEAMERAGREIDRWFVKLLAKSMLEKLRERRRDRIEEYESWGNE